MAAPKKKLKKIDFTVEGFDADGNPREVALKVVAPTASQIQEAELVYKKRYSEAVRSGVLLLVQLDEHMSSSGTWTDANKEEFARLRKVVVDGEMRLRRGGVRKSEARATALAMADARDALAALLAPRYAIQDNTAEAVGKQAENDFLVATSVRYGEGEDREGGLYFETPASYLERKNDPDAVVAAENFFRLVYGRQADRPKTPEEEFLAKYGFTDADGRLIDADGNPVDRDGRRLDAEGYFIDGEGRRVTADGEEIPSDDDFVEFLDG